MGTMAAPGRPSRNDSTWRARSSSSTSSTSTTVTRNGEGIERDHGEDAAEIPPRAAAARALPDHPLVPNLRRRGEGHDRHRLERPEGLAAPPVPRDDRDRRGAPRERLPGRRPFRRAPQTSRGPAPAPEAGVRADDGGGIPGSPRAQSYPRPRGGRPPGAQSR